MDRLFEKIKTTLREGTTLIPLPATRLKKLMQYTDVRLEMVQYMTELLKSRPKSHQTKTFAKNIVIVIRTITSVKDFETDLFLRDDEVSKAAEAAGPEANYKQFKAAFSLMWNNLLKLKLVPSIYREILIILPEKVMKHLTKPLHMGHFLLESFRKGGIFGILSLNGVFVMMQQYNFDVPDFYVKLYSMFTPSILHSKYRARFFSYSMDFLSSTHLSEHLVAGFVKKLARLSLSAPTPALPMIFDFISNLMIKHSGLSVLRSKPVVNLENGDPFLEDHPDPLQSKALESSLWEIKSLQSHAIPSVAIAAKFIDRGLPKIEKDLDETINIDYDDLWVEETKKSRLMDTTPSVLPTVGIFRSLF